MGCSLFHCLTSGKVEFISTSIGFAAFFQGAFFSRGAYHGSVFLFVDRRPFFARSIWMRLFCYRSTDFLPAGGALRARRLFLQCGSTNSFHPAWFFEWYYSSRIYDIFFHLQGFIESSFFSIMRIERLFFIRCCKHVDFSSVLSFCALSLF